MVEYKRRKAAADKNQKATTSRKASENAKRELTTMLLNESETLDDSDADPDFVPAKRGKSRAVDDSEDDDIYILPGLANDIPQEQEDQNVQTNVDVSHGPAKRKRMTHAERTCVKDEKKRLKIERNYFIKPGCLNNCKRSIKCSDIFKEEVRTAIHRHFWSLDYSGQKTFVLERVNQQSVKRRRADKDEQRKSISFKYTLKGEHVPCHEVCKTFFLGTLGFSPKNDSIITKTFKKAAAEGVVQDDRGKHSKHRTNEESVKQFIERYHPVISHYGREKTPHRRYLPCDLTLTDMHKEYVSTHGQLSYSAFYKVFKSMRISITSLGNEECDVCEKHRRHKETCSCIEICDVTEFTKHKAKYRAARVEYKNDAESNTARPQEIKVSADLQKVIMLPKIDEFKTCVFTTRLVNFNETFSELGKHGKDTAVVWHEAISGRRDEDIASAFHKYIDGLRDTKKITMWLDNCSGQNKNWTLYTMMLFIVNSPNYDVEEIHLKYFEPGHTFMASDAAHGRIEKQMRKTRKIYDFRDFVETIKQAKCEPLEMGFTDFIDWNSGVSQYALKQLGDKRPYMNEIVSARFETGSENIQYRTSFSGHETSVRVIKNSFQLADSYGEKRKIPRGVYPAKKAAIIQRLLPLMPENRRTFWMNLTEDRRAADLATNF